MLNNPTNLLQDSYHKHIKYIGVTKLTEQFEWLFLLITCPW